MKKNEYVSPEMEIVEFEMNNAILVDSEIGGKNPNPPFGVAEKGDIED